MQPRISFDLTQAFNTDAFMEAIRGPQPKKTVFETARREFQTTIFKPDPRLVARREEELANMPPPPEPEEIVEAPPKFERKFYLPPDPSNENKESKKVSQSEISQIITRLTNPNPTKCTSRLMNENVSNMQRSSSPGKKKNMDEQVFQRLYVDSTQPEMSPIRRPRTRNSYQSKKEVTIVRDETEELTMSIANQKLSKFINDAFSGKESITKKELTTIFFHLGVLESGEKLETVSQISALLTKWKNGIDTYDGNHIKNVLLKSLTSSKGKFRKFARKRMIIAMANHKTEILTPHPQNLTHSTIKPRMTQSTFDRLLSPRPVFEPPPEPEEEIVIIKPPLSTETQLILHHSKYANEPLEERDRQLKERAISRIKKMSEDFEKERLKMQKHPPVQIPELTPEERAKVEELKEKKKYPDIEIPPYHPTVMKYEDYLKVKEDMEEEKEKPKGWDGVVKRHRDGYEQYLKKKAEAESIRPLPKVPKSKRSRSVQKKEPPPPPPPPPVEEEPPKKGKKGRSKTQLSLKKPNAPKTARTAPGAASQLSKTPFLPKK